MKKYLKPLFEISFSKKSDLLLVSFGDGWAEDPFTQNNPLSQG